MELLSKESISSKDLFNSTFQRKRIGILLIFRPSWMGGIIYIINLINSLNFLDDEDKPEIIVFYNYNLERFTIDIQYPYLKLIPRNYPSVYKGFLMSWLKLKNIFVDDLIAEHGLDGIYPLNDHPVPATWKVNGKRVPKVGWIPDLQHKFYPGYFDKKRVFLRELRIKIALKNLNHLVVSSHDVENHFKKFYSIKKNLKIHVLNFVSIIDNFSFPQIESLREKYNVPKEYYMVSNQFTNHKNHIIILKALKLLKEKGVTGNVVMTGKMEFKGNSEYINEFREYIEKNQLKKNLFLLDIIPRQDQLGLMQHAKAILQPSFFEGWSTVIEDAKSLQVPVIAADLSVNIEQLKDTGNFFDPKDEYTLATVLENFPGKGQSDLYESYEKRVKQFAQNFIGIFNQDTGK